MSKYVRTANGVYDKGKFIKEANPFLDKVAKALGWEVYPVIKEANDIEDLCDEFVFETDDITPLICESYDELIYWFNHSKEEQYTTRNCYGAIWTDKGLIYVAKLNEKGEWELI